MAGEHKPRMMEDMKWEYPATDDVLCKVGLKPIRKLIEAQQAHIVKWVANYPLHNLCWAGGRRKGSIPHLYQWEQPLDLEEEASGDNPVVALDGNMTH